MDTSKLAELLLSGDANLIVGEVRKTAAECQNVVAKLTIRDQVNPQKLSDFGTAVSHMLMAVVRVRDQLVSVDLRIRQMNERDREIRRFRELAERITIAEGTGAFAEERRMRREMGLLAGSTQGKLARLRADIRSSMVFRLELLRYWWWFMRKALEMYDTLSEAIATHLMALRESLAEDDELRTSIEAVVGSQSKSAIKTEMASGAIPEDARELRAEVMSEITLLQETHQALEVKREECKELENTEVLLQAEIESAGENEVEHAPPLEEISPLDFGTPSQPSHRMTFQKRDGRR